MLPPPERQAPVNLTRSTRCDACRRGVTRICTRGGGIALLIRVPIGKQSASELIPSPPRNREMELLDHADVRTTMIYTHVLNRGGRGVCSPARSLKHAGTAPRHASSPNASPRPASCSAARALFSRTQPSRRPARRASFRTGGRRESTDYGPNVTRVMRPPGPTAQQAWREMQSTAQ
jgi:hypothetical protein